MSAIIESMKAGFLEKLIERLGRIGPEEVQNYLIRGLPRRKVFSKRFSTLSRKESL